MYITGMVTFLLALNNRIMSNLFERASEIRKDGEKWQDAVQRAKSIIDIEKASSSPKNSEKSKKTEPPKSKEWDWRDKTTPIS